jgi:AcrR family transcriptional regulator
MFKAEMNAVQKNAAQRREAFRERLVALAEATIAAAGLPGLKARDLAREAGCALGAIYQVVPDLDELILLVNGRTLAALDERLCEAAAQQPGAPPTERLVALAQAYLDYAAENRPRWDALFLHRLPPGRVLPDWYPQQQAVLFSRVRAPIAALCPGLAEAAQARLAYTLFSAVHGIVGLGLDRRVVAIDLDGLRKQLSLAVTALASGLAHATDREA